MENELTESQIYDRLRKDVIVLLYVQPFFAYLLTNMKKVIDKENKVPIAGVAIVDGDITLYINPKGYFSHNLKERTFILIHEVLHIIFHHHFRGEKKDHGLWNISTDVAINQLIDTENYARMPKGCLKIDSWNDTKGFILPEKKSAEDYYKLLLDKQEKMEKPNDMNDTPMGDFLPDENENNNSDKENKDSLAPSFRDMHKSWDQSDDMSKTVSENIINSALNEAFKESAGNVPQELKTYIEEILNPKINWRSILRNFVAKKRNTNKKATWKKHNRRLGRQVMGYKKNRKLNVAVAIDTSASITEDDFKIFFSEIIGIHRSGANVIILECDTKVHKIYKYKNGVSPDFTGRGGTDFCPVFDFINKKKDKLLNEKPDLLIFFTDGFGEAPEENNISTVWCLTENGKKPYTKNHNKVPWGIELNITK